MTYLVLGQKNLDSFSNCQVKRMRVINKYNYKNWWEKQQVKLMSANVIQQVRLKLDSVGARGLLDTTVFKFRLIAVRNTMSKEIKIYSYSIVLEILGWVAAEKGRKSDTG